MAKKLSLLVDTDVFIDYFNHQLFRELFEEGRFRIYYSVVTKKELFANKGLGESERKAISRFLRRHRIVSLDPSILGKYSELRRRHPSAAKEDAPIAATAIVKKFPLVTRNKRHFQIFNDLDLWLGYHP